MNDVRENSTFWQYFSGLDLKILSDKIHSRQLLASGLPGPPSLMVGTYASINLKFNWDSHRYQVFSTDHPEYDGWSPFVKY